MLGSRKCCCANKRTIRIQRASRGEWKIDVYPHFSKLQLNQTIKYGLVIAVASSKVHDVYSAVTKLIEPQREKILVPTIAKSG
jgi:hypothetical protein